MANQSPVLSDRIRGVILGLACGDALGAGYEFLPPLPLDVPVEMKGGGTFGWAPGEWTDDTSMAICIAQAAAQHKGLFTPAALDEVVRLWVEWAGEAADVGIQTRHVLASVAARPGAVTASEAARDLHDRGGRTAGNGSLMRTAPVALVCLDDEDALWRIAQDVSALTHYDPAAGEACALWCVAIRHAVLQGDLRGMRRALSRLPESRRQHWTAKLDAAEHGQPWEFDNNGWVESAFQAAWCSVHRSFSDGQLDTSSAKFTFALESAARSGHDTDTVAAIAGSLAGALWGAESIPGQWVAALHGYPGLQAADLGRLAIEIAAA